MTNGALIEDGVTQSFDIPEQNFGMTYHALMVPPFPMKTALFLGYGLGNVPYLMEKIFPVGCEITGVDTKEPPLDRQPPLFFNREAWQFVEWSEKVYDFVCIDLFRGKHIPDFVFKENFVDHLARITGKILAINCTFYKWNDFNVYGKHFLPDACKTVNEDKVMFLLPRRFFQEPKENG